MVANQLSTSRPLNIATLTHYLHHLSIRRLMNDSVSCVQEIATEYLEQRQTACWSVIILALIFNFAFVIASICSIITSPNEAPRVHLRVWIVGYAIKCGVHGVCVGVESKRRWEHVRVSDGESFEVTRNKNSSSDRDGEDVMLNLDLENVVQE